jgi:hypothetical protein
MGEKLERILGAMAAVEPQVEPAPEGDEDPFMWKITWSTFRP